jgi:hypothetical protein
MFATTLMVALAGFVASNALETPSWHADYWSAQRMGKEKHKPLAVFVGSGKEGWNQVDRGGQLSKDITQLLAKTYICVYVDTDLETGKRFAAELEISRGPGLVVSDHAGDYQAFHHRGDLPKDQLVRYLRRYADPERLVQTTETNSPVQQTSYYRPVRYSTGGC